MKFQVRVGQEFSGVVEVKHEHNTAGCTEVVVTVDTPRSVKNWRRFAFGGGIAASFITIPAAAYGFVTGDFSYLQAIADAANRLVAAVVDATITSMRSK